MDELPSIHEYPWETTVAKGLLDEVERLTETIIAMGLVGDVTEVVGKKYWADLKEGNARLQYILDAVKSASRDGRLDAFTVDAVIDYAEAEFAEAAKEQTNGR